MYVIYHLPQLKKVGCTSNFKQRMEQQDIKPPFDQYLKSVHRTIEEASLAEETLRKHYGYKEDSPMTYAQKFGKSDTKCKISPSPSVGWNELHIGATKDELRADLNKYTKITLGADGEKFSFEPSEYEQLVKKAKGSQYKDFYWQVTGLKAIKDANIRSNSDSGQAVANGPCTHENTIKEFQQIRDWAQERGLYEKGDPKSQFLKLQEEAGEVARAILKQDEPEIIDGLGDTLVVLINLAHLAGYKLEDCLAEAYDVISKRSGKMINGTFVKDGN